MPKWLKGDFVNVRKIVTNWAASQPRRITLTMARHQNIRSQLRALSLPPFQGRMHNGMDVSAPCSHSDSIITAVR